MVGEQRRVRHCLWGYLVGYLRDNLEDVCHDYGLFRHEWCFEGCWQYVETHRKIGACWITRDFGQQHLHCSLHCQGVNPSCCWLGAQSEEMKNMRLVVAEVRRGGGIFVKNLLRKSEQQRIEQIRGPGNYSY